MTSPTHRTVRLPIWGAVAGATLALLAFALEGLSLYQGPASGIALDVSGPLANLIGVARAELPAVIVRVALVYVLGGLTLGVIAAALSSLVKPPRGALVAANLICLTLLLLVDRAILRPALFLDVAWLRRPLAWLVDHGEPWQPRAMLVLLIAGHLVWAWLQGLRPRPRWLAFAAVGVALVAAASRWSAPSVGGPHPLVVVIGLDAFRPDRLSALGGRGDVAPALERFLQDATLFTNAYTPIAQTEAAWQTLLTARFPPRHGVRYALAADHRRRPSPSFAQVFAEHGYLTAFATDCSRFNYQDASSGFEWRMQPPRGALNFILEKVRFRGVGVFADNAIGAALLPSLVSNRALAGFYDSDGYAERLADRLLTLAARGPTLFAYHATAAHFPGDPVYPYYRRFVRQDAPLERRVRMHFAPVLAGSEHSGDSQLGTDAEALYDELLAQADGQLEILLAALKDAGLYDRATIVVLSDHGEDFYDEAPALKGQTPVHGVRLGPVQNQVVLAVKAPKSREARRVTQLVRLVDVGPTLLDLAGMPPLDEADGISLAPALRGEKLPSLRLYAETGLTHVMPDVLEPEHYAQASPRGFDAYDIHPDGQVEVSESAHGQISKEKDEGAFDGVNWLVRWRDKHEVVHERCKGECERSGLRAWLELTAAP